ncbi:MAG: efflux RND transporter periplasmic adaptor subunit, partial [Halieaceae bacterium]
IARAVIDNSDDRFRPGMAFEIALNVSRGSFLSVPDVAVQWGADGAYIWIDNKGKADRREARLIKRLPGVLLLEGNFVEGDLVVTEGVQAVRQGAQLRALNADSLDGNIREELGGVEGAR